MQEENQSNETTADLSGYGDIRVTELSRLHFASSLGSLQSVSKLSLLWQFFIQELKKLNLLVASLALLSVDITNPIPGVFDCLHPSGGGIGAGGC